MEHSSIWVTIAIGVVITVVGTILNTLITNKINEGNKRDDDLEKKHKEDIELVFRRHDALKEVLTKEYVRKEMYEQAMSFSQKETDTKFMNLVESMNKQFQNVENNIKDVKDLINEKFNHKN